MTGDVLLRAVREADLPVFFEQQVDPEANVMAAFVAEDPTDREAFLAHWAKILGDESVTTMTIVVDGQVAGHIASFEQFGKPSVSYWLGRPFWGRGIATRALAELLRRISMRPLYARAAKDNLGSLRVLEKCGFSICGEDTGFANARGREVEEFILVVNAPAGGEGAAARGATG